MGDRAIFRFLIQKSADSLVVSGQPPKTFDYLFEIVGFIGGATKIHLWPASYQ